MAYLSGPSYALVMNRVVAIYPPLGFSERGQRENNEDYILPAAGQATTDHRLFVVCDGVGGAEKGEVASSIAAESLVSYFNYHEDKAVDAQFVKNALLFIEEAFEQVIADDTDTDLKGMSTTLTLLSLHPQGVTIAHIGDSRVYHIRNGQVLHQTHDHSLVNELIRTKQILPEEAANHPRRNVITRAIQGQSRPTSCTVYITQEVDKDDYFFLCTDGVLECIDNRDLTTLLTTDSLPDEQKIERLTDLCAGEAKDNYSGYLIRVADVAPIERLSNTGDLEKDAVGSYQLLMDTNENQLVQDDGRNWIQRLFS